MEDKLLELKEQFCKWYCPNGDKVTDLNDNCNHQVWCEECDTYITCKQSNKYIGLCEVCQISEYIRFIRDEL